MAYSVILDSEIDAESPITESLMTRLRDNTLAFAQESFTVLTGSGNYAVPADVTKLKVLLVSGGGGGSGSSSTTSGGGGGGGRVVETFHTVTPLASLAFVCGGGGAGGAFNTIGTDGSSTTFDGLVSAGGTGGLVAALGGGNDPAGAGSGGASSMRAYCGGSGGRGTGVATSHARTGYSLLPCSGTPGTSSTVLDVGGGGAPMALPYWIDGVEAYLGAGGNGGAASTVGSNATLNGAGGGGGGKGGASTGGAGSAGIIFVLPIG